MKLIYLLIITVAAFFTAAAFRNSLHTTNSKTIAAAVAEKKKFAIGCSPEYIPAAGDDIPLLNGWGDYSWTISTRSDSAQIFFNQGINMYYAFHIIEARASFDKATKFDPDCAMAWWGKALAYGPNINDFEYLRPAEAFASAARATALKQLASPIEKALIDAIAVRYVADNKADQTALNVLYRDAMKKVFTKFNQDENVSVLYADALMLLHPWDLYHDYKPRPWTPEIVAVIEQALRINARQPGANHYYIHAVEASAKPLQALKSANLLAKAMPYVSHLTHMPSHIYIRSGNYAKGIDVNDQAVAGYNRYRKIFPAVEESSMLYDLHNVHMKLNCAQMAGNYQIAADASHDMQQKIPGFYLSLPGPLGYYIQYAHESLLFTWVRFGKWEQILNMPVVDSLHFTSILQHFARGVAFARTNNSKAAVAELTLMDRKMTEPSLKEPLPPFNSAFDGATIARHLLAGMIAEEKKDYHTAIAAFEKAVAAEDNLIYNEPRDWLLPARHYLGNAFVQAGKYPEALAVFNKDLLINPDNGWALTGVANCYRALKNKKALATAERRLTNAWVIKDVPIAAAVF